MNVPADELAEALIRFEAGRCAVHQAELDLIWAFDEKCHFALDGTANMATWLSLKFGWSSRASEAVRVAPALAVLPRIRDAYGQGRICWESVVALSRAANPENESELLEHALRMTSTELRALIASAEPVDVEDSNRAYEQRSLTYH